jgi:hypothetical protein
MARNVELPPMIDCLKAPRFIMAEGSQFTGIVLGGIRRASAYGPYVRLIILEENGSLLGFDVVNDASKSQLAQEGVTKGSNISVMCNGRVTSKKTGNEYWDVTVINHDNGSGEMNLDQLFGQE